jgi:hypothetical protein
MVKLEVELVQAHSKQHPKVLIFHQHFVCRRFGYKILSSNHNFSPQERQKIDLVYHKEFQMILLKAENMQGPLSHRHHMDVTLCIVERKKDFLLGTQLDLQLVQEWEWT